MCISGWFFDWFDCLVAVIGPEKDHHKLLYLSQVPMVGIEQVSMTNFIHSRKVLQSSMGIFKYTCLCKKTFVGLTYSNIGRLSDIIT